MDIFSTSDYRRFLRDWALHRPEKRGAYARLAEHLGVSSTMISQILSGSKSLSLEMADKLVEFLGLSEMESDYFFLLVDFDRAGTHSLKQRLTQKISKAQIKARELASRIKEDQSLDENTKSIYYSSWLFAGVRNATAIEGLQNLEALEAKLQVSREAIVRVVNFMLEKGLLSRDKNGNFQPEAKLTFIPAKSPLIVKHQQNWRIRGFQKMDDFDENNFFFTGPVSLSKELAEEIRRELPALVEKIASRISPSESQVVRCLNIDWFEY